MSAIAFSACEPHISPILPLPLLDDNPVAAYESAPGEGSPADKLTTNAPPSTERSSPCIYSSSETPPEADTSPSHLRRVKNGIEAEETATIPEPDGSRCDEVRSGILAITPTSLSFTGTGGTAQLQVTATDAAGSTIPAEGVKWKSTKQAVTVNSQGLVFAADTATALIIASAECCTPDTIQVTVSSPPPPPPPPPASGPIPAFPGAEGWGARALERCRSLPLRVHVVTNTNDSGPGSLRDILENRTSNAHYDMVIFRTGGTIESRSQTELMRSCVYVAGQTAPGSGILIRGHPTAGHGGFLIRVNTSGARTDIVFRFLRLRHGHESASGGGLGATGTGGASDIIFDHISATWGGRQAHLQVSRTSTSGPETVRTSIQNSIAAEGIDVRGTMFLSNKDASAYRFRQHSFHRNLVATVGHRTPRIHSGDAAISTDAGIEVVNNVMYNIQNRAVEGRWRSVIDFVKNYQDTGPHRGFRPNRWESESMVAKDVYGPLDPNDPGSLYAEGNHIVGFSGSDFESWRDHNNLNNTLPANFQRFNRMTLPLFPIGEMPALGAYDWVLDNAGASRRISCRGDWIPNRDSVDQRIVNYVRSRQGPSTTRNKSIAEIHGGWPTMHPGTPCKDTDNDGLPDEWEERYFGCATCADPNEITPSGYLVIEHYVNGTPPR